MYYNFFVMENILKTKTFSFLSSFAISMAVTIVSILQDMNSVGMSLLAFCIIGIIAAMILACIKEYVVGEEFDFKNILYSFIGCVCSVIVIFFGILFNILQ